MKDGWKSKLMSGGSLLIGSIVLNLFLVGVVSGAAMRGPLFPPSTPERARPPLPQRPAGLEAMNRGAPEFTRLRDSSQMFERIASGLEEADAGKLRSIIEQTQKETPSPRDEMQKSLQKVAGVLRQEKPDDAALQGALDEIQKAGQSTHEGMIKNIKRIAAEMSPDARAKIADVMERESSRLDRGMMGRPSDLRERMMQRRQMEASPEGRPERPRSDRPEKAE